MVAAFRGPRLPPRGAVALSAVFAGLFTVAVALGRLTVMDGTSLSLVWPAAGVAALWFCVQRTSGTRWLDYSALALITFTINYATGAGAPLSACFVVANVVQVAVLVALLPRWVPALWGAGGTEPLTGLRQLLLVLCAAVVATAAGALVGPTSVWALTGHWSWLTTAVWMFRNTTSVLLILTMGLRVGYLLHARDRARAATARGCREHVALPFEQMSHGRRLELFALVVVSLAAYALFFSYLDGLPLAFPLMALTVWAALRFDTTLVVVHGFALSVLAVLLTLSGEGPFIVVPDDATRAIIVQGYVALTTVLALALALGRDERAVLLNRVNEHARVVEEHSTHVEVLARAARRMYTSDDVRAEICAAARDITGADLVQLLEPDGEGHLVTTAGTGDATTTVRLRLDGEPSLTVAAFRGREHVFVADVPAHPGAATRVTQALGIASAAWQPVRTHAADSVGVLALVWHQPAPVQPAHVRPMLETLATEAAVAIERCDLMRRLAAAADRDGLTGLANRRRWDQAIAGDIARATRTGQPLTVALLDLDHFKRYNDTRGHLAGDELLRDFAAAAAEQVRDVDTLARWGGEEFALALPGCTADGALEVADRIRRAVPDGQTCTIGLAQWHPGETPAAVMRRADTALYTGKTNGRDTTTTAPSPEGLDQPDRPGQSGPLDRAVLPLAGDTPVVPQQRSTTSSQSTTTEATDSALHTMQRLTHDDQPAGRPLSPR